MIVKMLMTDLVGNSYLSREGRSGGNFLKERPEPNREVLMRNQTAPAVTGDTSGVCNKGGTAEGFFRP